MSTVLLIPFHNCLFVFLPPLDDAWGRVGPCCMGLHGTAECRLAQKPGYLVKLDKCFPTPLLHKSSYSSMQA